MWVGHFLDGCVIDHADHRNTHVHPHCIQVDEAEAADQSQGHTSCADPWH